MTISRTRFYRWLIAYGNFVSSDVDEGRDMLGRWFSMSKPKNQTEIDI